MIGKAGRREVRSPEGSWGSDRDAAAAWETACRKGLRGAQSTGGRRGASGSWEIGEAMNHWQDDFGFFIGGEWEGLSKLSGVASLGESTSQRERKEKQLSHTKVCDDPGMYQTLYCMYCVPFFTVALHDKHDYPDWIGEKQRQRIGEKQKSFARGYLASKWWNLQSNSGVRKFGGLSGPAVDCDIKH